MLFPLPLSSPDKGRNPCPRADINVDLRKIPIIMLVLIYNTELLNQVNLEDQSFYPQQSLTL